MTGGSVGGGPAHAAASAEAARDRARAQRRAGIRASASLEEVARAAGLPVPKSLYVPRWFALTVIAGAVLFVPWIVYLDIELPTRVSTAHYDLMWVGFDGARGAVLRGLAVAGVRRG